ncbi:MAG: class III cytochrome C family protein [Bacteroidetes bacterium]|nr:class III cytochrome C family protein [Bacteroidota bacterium]MBP6403890.1 class III cytochrome C family protein [Bacteroidia bacterium]MBP6648630.1 class III cytochrome C family protein [Bacteroidia bacterium]
MKKLSVVGTLFITILLMVQFPHWMLSPGEVIEGHQNIKNKCSECHQAFSGIDSQKCISCHKLDSIGMNSPGNMDSNPDSGKILFHQHLKSQECTTCHTDHNGRLPERATVSFDHSLLAPAIINTCNSCHQAPKDKLHKLVNTDCKKCHDAIKWKTGATFNHDLIVAGNQNNCSSCHAVPNDDYHKSITDNCTLCHSIEKWKPSTFQHSDYFQLDKDHNVQCSTCHIPSNFKSYTCYGCHEHSLNKIKQEHNEEGIYSFDNCTKCHKSANEHDIRMNVGPENKTNQDNTFQRKEKKKDSKGENEDD